MKSGDFVELASTDNGSSAFKLIAKGSSHLVARVGKNSCSNPACLVAAHGAKPQHVTIELDSIPGKWFCERAFQPAKNPPAMVKGNGSIVGKAPEPRRDPALALYSEISDWDLLPDPTTEDYAKHIPTLDELNERERKQMLESQTKEE